MRAVILAVAATFVVGGIGLFVAARYAPSRVAPLQVGPCEAQALAAEAAPCARDPRLAGLGTVLDSAPLAGYGCVKAAPAPSGRSIQVLGRRGDRTRLRLRGSTVSVADGATVVVGDQRGGTLDAVALTCKR